MWGSPGFQQIGGFWAGRRPAQWGGEGEAAIAAGRGWWWRMVRAWSEGGYVRKKMNMPRLRRKKGYEPLDSDLTGGNPSD